MAPAAPVTHKVSSASSARGSQENNFDELETATPGAISLSLQGRIGRLRYLAYAWPMMALSGLGILAALAGPLLHKTAIVILMVPVGLLWFWTGLRLMALRMHDLNRSSKWLLLLFLLPALSYALGPQMGAIGTGIVWAIALLLMVLPGSDFDNDYGPPPDANTTLVTVGASIALVFISLAVVGNIRYMQMRSANLHPTHLTDQSTAGEQPGSGNVRNGR